MRHAASAAAAVIRAAFCRNRHARIVARRRVQRPATRPCEAIGPSTLRPSTVRTGVSNASRPSAIFSKDESDLDPFCAKTARKRVALKGRYHG